MKAVPGILPTLLEMICFFSTPTIDVEPYFCLGQYDTAWGVRPAICDGGGEHQTAELGCSC